jgi:hypothetical protein
VAKRYEDPIEVATEEAGPDVAPLAFRWRGRQYFVDERLSSWREAGEWWQAAGSAAAQNKDAVGSTTDGLGHRPEQNGSGEVREREYFRVLAHPAGMGATGELDADGFFVSCSSVYDIYRDRIKGVWRMARVWD